MLHSRRARLLLVSIAGCTAWGPSSQAAPVCAFDAASIPAAVSVWTMEYPADYAPGVNQPYCRVRALLKPTPASEIWIDVSLPKDGWNGKFLGLGNGGYAGEIQYQPLIEGLVRKYAVATTDMGMPPKGGVAIEDCFAHRIVASGSAAAGNREKWRDFGFRATQAMTAAAKYIVTKYYGVPPQKSYFMGCSTGGQQALMTAQRRATDYDGIIAGAPGHNRTRLHASGIWTFKAIRRPTTTPSFVFEPDKLVLLQKYMLDKCEADGFNGARAYLTNPARCNVDPQGIQCTAGATDCLDAEEVAAAWKLYMGPRRPGTTLQIFPGLPRGCEALPENALVFAGPSLPTNNAPCAQVAAAPTFDGLFKWVFANWKWETFNFASDMDRVDQVLGADLNATSADLRAFADRGGKLILYAGWADAIVPAQDTVNYYDSVVAFMAANNRGGLETTQKFARLFLAPGLAHCGSGPGPNVFNGAGNYGPPRYPAHEYDILAALDRWVTQEIPPERIVATLYDGGVFRMDRPLCPYPKSARYVSGDRNLAQSFTCAN